MVGQGALLYPAATDDDRREVAMTEGGGRSKRSEAGLKGAATKGPEELRRIGLKSAATKGVEAMREAARKGAAKRSPEQRRETALRAAETRKRNKEARGSGASGS
jgi:hypothetical protein